MFRIALKNVVAHRRRLASTFLAVTLGIAFLSGTLVLGDTISRSFRNLLSTVNSGVDAYVRRRAPLVGGADGLGGQPRGTLDETTIAAVAAVPGVAHAEGEVRAGGVQVVDKAGKVMGGGRGVPSRGASWRTDPTLNPFRLAAGTPPAAPDDVVLDRATAGKAGFHVGDTVTVLVPDARPFRLTGIATFGGQDSPGGGTQALFTLSTAQQLLGTPGKVDAVVVRGQPGVSQTELAARINRALPASAEALTGAAIVKETQDAFQQRISGFTTFLSSFAWVAVIVGAFVIYNTFSIIVAQRTRETALLRAVGASRRQILSSVVVESFAAGLAGSTVGVVLGIGVGALLRALFRAGGFPFPPGGLVLQGATVLTGLIVGVLVTVGAALAPALRASRVAPVAALRDAAIDTSNRSRGRAIAGVIVTAAGLAAMVDGVVVKNASRIGIGAAFTLIGVLLLGPLTAVPVARLVGAPARLRGVTGVMARENAMRNPRRTSGTAAALLVGVAVVTFFTVIAASLQATTNDQIDRSFIGDVSVAGGGFRRGGFSPELAKRLARLPEVSAAAALRLSEVSVGDRSIEVLATDPAALARVLKIDVTGGSLDDLKGNQIALSSSNARDLHVGLGDPVTLHYADSGDHPLTVGAVFKESDIMPAGYIIPTAADDAFAARPLDDGVFVKFRSGVPFAQGRAAVEGVAKDYPAARVEDQHDIKQGYTSRINSFLAVIFGMLALAIIIALIGISNTLQLSVYERTRELGLLRAVGTTRSQLRSMVRWESVIIALFGTLGGVGLGITFGWAIVHGLGRDSNIIFAVPVLRAAVIVVVGATAGVLAAVRPASRAGRLDVLRAIATE